MFIIVGSDVLVSFPLSFVVWNAFLGVFVFPEDNQLTDKTQLSVDLKKYFDFCNAMNENDPHRLLLFEFPVDGILGKN